MRQIPGSLPVSPIRPLLATSKRIRRNASVIRHGQGEEELEEEFQQFEEDMRHEESSLGSSLLNIPKHPPGRIIAASVLAYIARTSEY